VVHFITADLYLSSLVITQTYLLLPWYYLMLTYYLSSFLLYGEVGKASLLPLFCGVLGHVLYNPLRLNEYLCFVVLLTGFFSFVQNDET
jgi:hypothetical protein